MKNQRDFDSKTWHNICMNMKHLLSKTSRDSFTLVEIMIVVAIIGLLAAIAIPSFQKARHNSQKNAFINDVRIFRDAVQIYNLEHKGLFPTNKSPGIMPPELSEYLTKFPWSNGPSIGGRWDWDYNAGGVPFKAGLTVYDPDWDDTDMLEIDTDIDDGNLSSGVFRKIGSGDYTYTLDY